MAHGGRAASLFCAYQGSLAISSRRDASVFVRGERTDIVSVAGMSPIFRPARSKGASIPKIVCDFESAVGSTPRRSRTPRVAPSLIREVRAMFKGLSFAVVFALTGCSSMGFGSSEDALKKQVSFDHNCPAEKVDVVASQEGGVGHASFKVAACGQDLRYERMGASYFDAAKGSPVDQAMGKSAAPSSSASP